MPHYGQKGKKGFAKYSYGTQRHCLAHRKGEKKAPAAPTPPPQHQTNADTIQLLVASAVVATGVECPLLDGSSTVTNKPDGMVTLSLTQAELDKYNNFLRSGSTPSKKRRSSPTNGQLPRRKRGSTSPWPTENNPEKRKKKSTGTDSCRDEVAIRQLISLYYVHILGAPPEE